MNETNWGYRYYRRGLTGPIVLITLGVLFLLERMHVAPFGKLWPILLLVIGIVKLLEATVPRGGNTGPLPPSPPGPPAPPTLPPS